MNSLRILWGLKNHNDIFLFRFEEMKNILNNILMKYMEALILSNPFTYILIIFIYRWFSEEHTNTYPSIV